MKFAKGFEPKLRVGFDGSGGAYYESCYESCYESFDKGGNMEGNDRCVRILLLPECTSHLVAYTANHGFHGLRGLKICNVKQSANRRTE